MDAAMPESQRDVVFTPLMLRVRGVLVGAEPGPAPRLVTSFSRGIAAVNDEWVYLRCRGEQVIAEANSMLPAGSETFDVIDEYGTGELAFVLRLGERSMRISMGRSGRKGWVELVRSYLPGDELVEPEEGAVLEDLIAEMLSNHLARPKASGCGDG